MKTKNKEYRAYTSTDGDENSSEIVVAPNIHGVRKVGKLQNTPYVKIRRIYE